MNSRSDSDKISLVYGIDYVEKKMGNNEQDFEETRPYTRQHQLRAGVQGQYGSWAGAVTEICSPFSSKRPKTRSDYGPTDRRTDRPTQ